MINFSSLTASDVYEQFDGVSMGPPWDPIRKHIYVFLGGETSQRRTNTLALAIMPSLPAATAFLDVLNSKHPSLKFTMEIATNNTVCCPVSYTLVCNRYIFSSVR